LSGAFFPICNWNRKSSGSVGCPRRRSSFCSTARPSANQLTTLIRESRHTRVGLELGLDGALVPRRVKYGRADYCFSAGFSAEFCYCFLLSSPSPFPGDGGVGHRRDLQSLLHHGGRWPVLLRPLKPLSRFFFSRQTVMPSMSSYRHTSTTAGDEFPIIAVAPGRTNLRVWRSQNPHGLKTHGGDAQLA